MTSPPETYFRKGFGLRAEVREELAADYSGWIVDRLRDHDYTLVAGEATVRLAREFGFCYGVERAVEYAYESRRKFPDRRIFLAGEIIHNPHVNDRLRRMEITILEPNDRGEEYPRFDYAMVRPDDVVVLPAFGVTIRDFEALRRIGCVMVDTTCGSVLNVWKRVERYAQDGFTSLVHGKWQHEETQATVSQVRRYPGGRFIIVRDMDEARLVCDYVEALGAGRATAEDAARVRDQLGHGMCREFDPERDLRRIGVANQTTMLARESLAIGEAVGQAMARGFGDAYRVENFRTFDTICSATQDRQDAVLELLREPLDLMVVVGGYNSSNTISLAMLCAERVPTYHVEDAASIDLATGEIRYRAAGKAHREVVAREWLPREGSVRIGVTAGASTPNNRIGEAIAHILAVRGIALEREPAAG